MARTVAPYGSWVSPITAELLTERAVTLSQLGVVGGRLAWNELRPAEQGRQVVVSAHPGGGVVDLVPSGYSARTQVHEYGGRCFVADGDSVISSNWEDQRLWRFRPGADPQPLTAAPASPRALRFADPVLTPAGDLLVAVRERHGDPGVLNDLVAIPLDRSGGSAEPVVLAEGHDFFAAPAVSPDGRRVAWVSWDQPNMPWDGSELWVAELRGTELDSPRRVAGGRDESVQQPRFSADGRLHFVSDRSGWWNLYDESGPLCARDAEFGQPMWVFGVSTYAFSAGGELVASFHGPGGGGIGVVRDGAVHPFDLPYASYDSLVAFGDGVACIAASPSTAPAVIAIDAGGRHEVVRVSREIDIDPGFLSRPERVRYPTAGGEHAWALVYPPASATYEGSPQERPPLVVISHGGPTGQASSALNLSVQFWTSRGFTVADVDYRGSAGYGRAYRNRLRDSWGICDVEDVAAIAGFLAASGRVDGRRCVIRGGSAGGFTTLAALATTDVFAAGANLFGVSDLLALAHDTHKFESRYLDLLVGPLPETEQRYRDRSPINHLDGFTAPLIVFQGLEDAVVPPPQSERIVEALRRRGIPVAYFAFEGEQHGFRRAETIRTVARAELTFYGKMLGFQPDETLDFEIENYRG